MEYLSSKNWACWDNICRYQNPELQVSEISSENLKGFWKNISKYQYLSESFIEEFKYYLDIDLINVNLKILKHKLMYCIPYLSGATQLITLYDKNIWLIIYEYIDNNIYTDE